MSVFVANTYYYQYDQKQWETAMPYPPLGTLYAASELRKAGYQTTVFDNNLVKHHSEVYDHLDRVKPEYLVLYDDGFNYLTKMCLTTMQEAAFDVIKRAKSLGCTVICNSSDSTDHFQRYHDNGADYVIHGEGETTLIELIDYLEAGDSTQHLQGISYLAQGTVIKNAKRPVSKQLDDLSFPTRADIDIEAYRNIWEGKHGTFALNIATTRGCPYKCNWCAKPIYGNRYNTRSPLDVINEIEYLTTTYNVDYFWMCDDIFGLKPGWVQEFRDLKQERGLKFRYKIQSRADLMLKEDNLDALADSGADTIWLGAESGSQRILDAMDKGTTVEQIYTATKNLKERNVKVAFFLQFGYLTETWEEVQQTIQMVMDLMPDEIGISVSYPLPGTKFYDKVKADLVMKSNWTDSDDLDMMFENTYPTAFYKVLHRYVHNRYRINKGLLRLKGQLQSRQDSMLKDIARMVYHTPLAFLNKRKLQSHL